MSYTVKAKLDTWFKSSPVQGSSLDDDEKEFFKAGTEFEIAAYAAEGNHLKITLSKDEQGQQIFIQGRNTWYLYEEAIELLNNGQVVDLNQPTPATTGAGVSGNLPRSGVELIKEFEGYAKELPDGRAEAYADPIHGWQVPTIGYGTTVYPDGSKVKQGDVITREQAEEYLIDHIEHSTRSVLEQIPTWGKMNDNQRGAIYSFAYNLGAAFYGNSGFQSITRVCDSPELWKDKAWITEQFVKYRNPGTFAEAGLRRRREAEADLFCS
ncbi:MAG: lysozyme [Leptolyngbya sp. SIO1D8]|nr:lysozyme [Leptolyngbya sp. SIO1D8]